MTSTLERPGHSRRFTIDRIQDQFVQAVRILAFPTIAYVLSRLIVTLGIASGAVLSPEFSFLETLGRWDSGYYVDIARGGYVGMNIGQPGAEHYAFPPGYPLAIRFVSQVFNLDPLWAAIGISVVFGLIATLLLHSITTRVYSRTIADRATLLFVFFPGSFVLSLCYSEAMMIAFSIGSLLALLKRRWIIAGLLGALATGTRANALPLAIAAAWAAGLFIYQRRSLWSLRALTAPLLIPLGFFTYLIFVHSRTGSWSTWGDVQEKYWQQETNPFAIFKLFDVVAESHGHLLVGNIDLAGIAFILIAATLALWKRIHMPIELWIYAVGLIGLTMLSVNLMPRPRFLLAAFPLLMIAAAAMKDRNLAFPLVLATSASLLVLNTAVTMASPLMAP